MATINKVQVTEQNDFIVEKDSRAYGGPAAVVALKVDGKTGAVSLPQTLLQDYWDKAAADGAAATTLAEHTFFRAPGNVTIKAIVYVPDATLTANDTTYATITIASRDSGGNSVNSSFASVTTKITGGSGNWSAFVPVPLTLNGATLTKDQILTIAIAKASTGVVVPAGSLQIYYTMS